MDDHAVDGDVHLRAVSPQHTHANSYHDKTDTHGSVHTACCKGTVARAYAAVDGRTVSVPTITGFDSDVLPVSCLLHTRAPDDGFTAYTEKSDAPTYTTPSGPITGLVTNDLLAGWAHAATFNTVPTAAGPAAVDTPVWTPD